MAKPAGTGKKSESTESKAKKVSSAKAEETKKPRVEAKSEDRAPKAAAPKKAKVAKAAKEKVGRVGGKCCKMKGCKREYRAKGYCRTHYKQWRMGAYGKKRYKPCKDMSCFKPMAMNRHGFCEDHFQNYYVKGMEQAKVPHAEKPAAKVAEAKAPAEAKSA